MMKNIGIISYNIHCNFTNYGSALQSWALNQVIGRIEGFRPVLVDYCPDILADKNPLDPFKNMWDQDEESRLLCKLAMPAIRKNYIKFDQFYTKRFNRTSKEYNSSNFNEITVDENITSFCCGSDTIFCPDEFGFDDGYYANYDVMKGHSVAYAASFGDPHFSEESYAILNQRLQNFKAFGLRENLMIPYVSQHTDVPVQKVLDPTLLLTEKDYESIVEKRQIPEKYLLLYSRRNNPKMEEYAERIAKKNGLKVVEISLRVTNSEKGHIMSYESGVEEFLSLVKHAEFVVTNSFHGMIFSVQFRREFVVFSREQCDTKIVELLELFGLSKRMITSDELYLSRIDYQDVHNRIDNARKDSIEFLKMELDLL